MTWHLYEKNLLKRERKNMENNEENNDENKSYAINETVLIL